MKKNILLFYAFAILISCNKEMAVVPEHDSTETVIHAYAPGTCDTKSVLDDNGVSVLWEDGDKIKVALSPNPYTTGSISSAIVSDNFSTTLSESSQNAYFVGYLGDIDTKKYRFGICLYPNTVSYTASKKYDSGENNVTENISYNLPNNQIAGKDGSFGKNYNLASAYISAQDIKDNKVPNVLFTNACGLIKIILPESASDVRSIQIASNSNVALAGNASLTKTQIDWDYDSSQTNEFTYRLTSPSFNGEGISEVLLTNNGEAFIPGIEYNIVVWPGTHNSGLRFTFTDSEGKTCIKELSEQIVLEASKFDLFNFKSEFIFVHIPFLELSTTSIAPAKTGETLSFNVNCNSDWTITKNVDWISVSPSSGVAGNTPINVTIAGNMTSSVRTATITVTHAAGVDKTISVSQDYATYKISGDKLTYADELTDGLYVIANKHYYTSFWTNGSGKLTMSIQSTTATFNGKHVFEYKYDASKINTSIDNYGSWSAGSWKSLSTGKYLDENFNLNADENNAVYLVSANNWGNNGGGELDGYDVYHSKTTYDDKYTLWYNGATFKFGDMALYYSGGSGVNKRKYYVYRVVPE